ncbi:hypothetical protein [Actinophytocola glycyrrhizae]|uniref:Uncharacterized protein n=1 Tax=Actinophytocola glycyrrhizae TaxID=2044873 RepID=A0ABV9S7Y6_9PSEU
MLGVVAFGAEEGEGEVDAFDLTFPAFGFRAIAAGEEIGPSSLSRASIVGLT